MANKRIKTKASDPRKVGGRYHCGYWRQDYTVTAINDSGFGYKQFTVQWADRHVTTHATMWDPKRDRVLEE